MSGHGVYFKDQELEQPPYSDEIKKRHLPVSFVKIRNFSFYFESAQGFKSTTLTNSPVFAFTKTVKSRFFPWSGTYLSV
jgi:hypothetical protein